MFKNIMATVGILFCGYHLIQYGQKRALGMASTATLERELASRKGS